MNLETRCGAGSYLAVVVMVYFAVQGAPTWMVLLCGIGLGTLTALVLMWLSSIFQVSHIVFCIARSLFYRKEQISTEALECSMAYLYEYTKQMSDLQKRTSGRSHD